MPLIKYLVFPVLVNLIVWNNLNSQPCNDPFSPGIGPGGCINAPLFCTVGALDNYCSSNANTPPGICPVEFCGTCENNQWFAFVANSTTVSLWITPFNCSGGNGGGLQAQMYQTNNCTNFTAISSCFAGGIDVINPFEISSSVDLIIGEIYYLMIDGWAGAACDYTLDVLQGVGNAPVPVIGEIQGEINACTGLVLSYSVPMALAATHYEWTISPNLGSIIGGAGTNSVQIVWNEQGVAEVCVTPSNGCETGASQCVVVESVFSSPTMLQDTLCMPDCFTIGDETYCESGTYNVVIGDPGSCDSVIILELHVIPLPVQPFVEETSNPWGDSLRTYRVIPNITTENYIWTVPPYAEIVAIQGTHLIVVNWFESAGGVVCVRASNFCGLSEESCVNTVLTSAQEQPATVQIRLFPNPVTDAFQLELSEGLRTDGQLLLHHVDGRLLRSWPLPAGMQLHSFSTDGLPGGLYLWTLKEQDYRVQGGKLVIW